MSRKAVNRLHENKAQLNSISMHLGESVGMALHNLISYFHANTYMPTFLTLLFCCESNVTISLIGNFFQKS